MPGRHAARLQVGLPARCSLYNGTPPERLIDAFQPEIGEDRWQPASYMRDLIPFAAAAQEGALRMWNKAQKVAWGNLNPVWSTIGKMLSNTN